MTIYRTSDQKFFILLSALANVLVTGALGAMGIYHLYYPWIRYRNLAILLLFISYVLKIQLYIQKLEIMEKRVSTLLQPGMRISKFEASVSSFTLMLYLILFWSCVIAVGFAFLPAGWWAKYL